MEPAFTPITGEKQGTIACILQRSYAELLATEPFWQSECAGWDQYDKDVFTYPLTIGASLFLTRVDGHIIGFASWDRRRQPECGIIGHNCILPEFRGRGFGRLQIAEVLRQFQVLGIRRATVTTNDHPYFMPAQRMYAACGFREIRRRPWENNPTMMLIEYEKGLD